MADYWKSTPKYWCKFCNIFVRDTKFEKQQHEATGKHQGAIQRSLRTLHRDKERETREQQRAKDEVARLNGVVAATGTSSKDALPRKPVAPLRQRTEQDRKQQIAQLAALGVEVPDEFRQENAMAGNWQSVSTKPVMPDLTSEQAKLNTGVRKRKVEEDDGQDAVAAPVHKAGWGRTFKSLPEDDNGADLMALFPGNSLAIKSEGDNEAVDAQLPERKQGITPDENEDTQIKPDPAMQPNGTITAGAEESNQPILPTDPRTKREDDVPPKIKEEQTTSDGTGVVFKKRKKAVKPR